LNPGKKITVLFLLITIPAFYITAQSTTGTTTATTFVTDDTPQWLKDLRRWEIVAFGSIPFTMFFATFGMDMYRWNNANGMDFSDRRYAPWPLKSAGGVPMEWEEQEMVFIIAASMSVTIAFADLAIVQIKRYRARKRAEAIPAGTTIITRMPLSAEPSEELNGFDGEDAPRPDSPSAEEP
jgi:hypothetical protein